MQNAKLQCCVQITNRKGLSSFLVLTAKFEMSIDLVRSILKAKMYKFWSWNVLVKCNSCSYFVTWLFNLSSFAAKYCWGMWEESLWHLKMIWSTNRITSHYHKCSLVSKGKNSFIYKPIWNSQSHTAMRVWFSMVDYLQTLTDSQQNHSRILKNQQFGFRKCLSRYSSYVSMTSSGFVEFYITRITVLFNEQWIIV